MLLICAYFSLHNLSILFMCCDKSVLFWIVILRQNIWLYFSYVLIIERKVINLSNFSYSYILSFYQTRYEKSELCEICWFTQFQSIKFLAVISLSLVDLHHCRYLSSLCLQGFRNYFVIICMIMLLLVHSNRKIYYKTNITNMYIFLIKDWGIYSSILIFLANFEKLRMKKLVWRIIWHSVSSKLAMRYQNVLFQWTNKCQ